MSARAGVFMDRDGTLSAEVGYVTALDQFRLLPGAARAVRALNEASIPAILVTNQSGIARGLFDEALLDEVHALMERLLRDEGARLDGIYVCPHHPEMGEPPWRRACDCRKPEPGLILRAASRHGVDPARSYVVGDSARDLEAGVRAGCRPVLVLTGYGRDELRTRIDPSGLVPAFVGEDLLDAVRWILAEETSS